MVTAKNVLLNAPETYARTHFYFGDWGKLDEEMRREPEKNKCVLSSDCLLI